jgi:anti-sigma factor RsiW
MNEQHITPERLIDYLHGELAPEDDARVLSHIDSCPSCLEAYETEAQLTDLLRSWKSDERELPAGVVASIWDRIERERVPTWQTYLGWFMRPALTVPVAAMLVVGVYFGVASVHGTGAKTSIDAAYYLDDHAALTKSIPFDEASSSVVPASLENDDPEADQQWVATADVHSTNDSP